MDLLIAESLEPEVISWLEMRHAVRYAPHLARDPRAFRQGLYDVRALIIPPTLALDALTLQQAPMLRAVGRVSAGAENIDLDACARAGVEVVRSLTATARAEAEFMVHAMLSLLRRFPVVGADGNLAGRELSGCTVGVIGMSAAARSMAQLLSGFDTRLVGYDPARSCGLMAAGGIIAPVIPPSIGFLLFGVVANVSITRLFLAGIFPGVLMGASLVVAWWLVSRRMHMQLAPRKSYAERARLLGKGVWALMLPVIIVGGLKFGIFTPTEAAVVAAAYALFVGAAVYRELTPKSVYHCLLVSARTSAVVLLLASFAMVASYMITIANIPDQIGSSLAVLGDSPLVLASAMMLVVFFAGMVLDFIPIVLIFTPVFLPIIQQAGIDPVYFGVIFIVNCSLGMITPPVGVVLNVVSSIGKVTLAQATRGVLPFLVAELAVLVALLLFPSLVMVPAQWWR